MKNIVSARVPALKPLPGELTPSAIRDAVLPVKIEAMRNAIAKCTELPELLDYKRTVDGLAAAARTIKHEIPEQVAMLNRTAKEALLRMGELLLQYNGSVVFTGGKKGSQKAERTKMAESLGLKKELVFHVTRLAAAPKSIIENILQDDSVSANHQRLAKKAPRRFESGRSEHSDSMRLILGGRDSRNYGLNRAASALQDVPLDVFANLSDIERKIVRKKIVECQELLDAMEQRL